jgi:glycosyltransferase involved in cell wall biosynthesis
MCETAAFAGGCGHGIGRRVRAIDAGETTDRTVRMVFDGVELATAADAAIGGIERLLVVTDTWRPQINGVVSTIEALGAVLAPLGCRMSVIDPSQFVSVPLPSYPELRLGLVGRRRMAAAMQAETPQSVHIATEGPLGWAARAACRMLDWNYTTAFHTRFPDYVHARLRMPRRWTWSVLRRFHDESRAVLAATNALSAELVGHGFRRVVRWGRGVDLELFQPEPRHAYDQLPRPVFLYVGRLAVEKNVEAFLALDLPGTKVVIGDGPMRGALQRRFPAARFLGAIPHVALGPYYAGADVMVLPSQSETFGLVMLEALACGTPLAAAPSPVLEEVVGSAPVARWAVDLRAACLGALGLDRRACRRFAETLSWTHCAREFLGHMTPLRRQPQPDAADGPMQKV